MRGVEMVFRQADPSEAIPLRHRVLRAGLPEETAVFEGDREPDTRHFVAERDGRILACATLVRREWQGRPAWQLRGMAVEPEQQRSGVGGQLLRHVETWVHDYSPLRTLWCNARSPAVRFYLKHGWRVVSEEFEIPTAGPHYRMHKDLGAVPQ